MQKHFLTFVVTVSIFLVCIAVLLNIKKVDASTPYGNDYVSTTTRTAFAGLAYTSTNSLLGTTSAQTGTLGSVVITGKNTGTINIYDGTSTAAHSDYGTTTLATFPSNTPEGTYTFDARFYKGLVIEVTGLAASSTVTYRGQ